MKGSVKENLFVASMPVLAFIGAYLFETGYADAFGYDHYLIELNLKLIVVGLICVGIIFWPVAFIIFAMINLDRDFGRLGRAISMPFIIPLLSIIIFIAFGFQAEAMKWFIIISLTYAIFTLIRIFIRSRKVGGVQSLEEFARSEGVIEFVGPPKPPSFPALSNFLVKIQAWLMVTICLVAFGFLVRGAGVGVANLKSSYSVFFVEDKEYALVAIYGDSMVLAGVTEEAHNGEIILMGKSSAPLSGIHQAYLPNFISKNRFN